MPLLFAWMLLKSVLKLLSYVVFLPWVEPGARVCIWTVYLGPDPQKQAEGNTVGESPWCPGAHLSMGLGAPGHFLLPSIPPLPMLWFRRCKRHGFSPWVRKIPWRREWQPTPVFLPGKSQGQKSLMGHSPRCLKQSDTTECTHACACTHTHTPTWSKIDGKVGSQRSAESHLGLGDD